MEKEMYEKAIDAYQKFIQRYKEWMYLYAIFVGALFVAFYSMSDGVNLQIIVSIVGIIASFCWLGSFYGYYYWLLSWTKILHYHEEKFLKATYNNETNINNNRLYSLVFKEFTNKYGFSTQKITNFFIRVVIIAWCYLLCYQIPLLSDYKCLWMTILAVLTVLFLLCPIIFRKKSKRSKCWLYSTTENMKNLKYENNQFIVE